MENDQTDLAKRLEQVEQQLEQLHVRLAALDAVGSTVKAPFTVTDNNGSKLLEIVNNPNDISLRLFNSQGKLAASLGADGTKCGYIAIRNAEERLVGYLSVENYGGRLIIQDNNEDGGVYIHGGECDNEGAGIVVGSTGGWNSSRLDIWVTPSGGSIKTTNGSDEQIVAWPKSGG